MAGSAPRDVFINCAFDDDFNPGFRALVFAVLASGFRARCAREMDDASETRIDKIYSIVEQSRFGIHDLSRTELDKDNQLPRFNMPMELGIFLAAKRFGDDQQKKKRALILDTEKFRFQKFISDLSGMDIHAHGGDPRQIVTCTRDWLATVSKRTTIATTGPLLDSYDRFTAALPGIAQVGGLNELALAYPDFERLTLAWVKSEGLAARLP